MRIDPETFLVLTLLMGTGAAVGVAAMTSRADVDEAAAVEDSVEPVAQAPASEEPAAPEPTPAAPATPPVVTPGAATTGAPEEPWVDPFPIVPDDPNAVPGPDFEGF